LKLALNEKSTDYELVDALLKSDIEAFDLIFKKYGTRLFGFSMKYLKSKEDAEELVQRVFLKIWENREKLDKESSLKSYLFTVSYHDLCRIFRKRHYQTKLEKEILSTSTESFTIDDRIDYQSILEQVNLLIDKLPPKQKVIFVKSRMEGKSSREIASEMSLAPGTVDNHISEALKFIRKNIANSNLPLFLFFSVFVG